jgi:alpha-ribazole phosphatase
MRIYWLRHPKPLVASGICYGASDVPCTADAIEQAALALRDEIPFGLKVLSSPLQRCEHLAQCLQGLRPDLRYETDARLAEIDFGLWEGLAWDAIPRAELDAWTEDFVNERCGKNGESAGQLIDRVASVLMEGTASGQDQLWITHAGVIRALKWMANQPYSLMVALAGQPSRLELLRALRAADWPQNEVPWGQLVAWDWPPAWPRPPRG